MRIHLPALLGALLAATALAGCSGDGGDGGGDPTPTPSGTPTPGATPTPGSSPSPTPGGGPPAASERRQFADEPVDANSVNALSIEATVPEGARNVTFTLVGGTYAYTTLTVELTGCGEHQFGTSGLSAGSGGETESGVVCDAAEPGGQEIVITVAAGRFEGSIQMSAEVPAA